MNKQRGGFTIIETVLFLGISGILIVALLAGTGASINQQRYRDAVESFKSLLQDQYGELTSVQNGRSPDWTCDGNGKTNQTSLSGNGVAAGQSKCVFVGRYVTIETSTITTYSVTAPDTSSKTLKSGFDVEKMAANYTYNLADSSKEVSQLEWGTVINWPRVSSSGTQQSPDNRSIAVLFLRSPDTGSLYTFTSDVVPLTPTPETLKAMIVAGVANIPGQSARTICIDSNNATVGSDRSVYIGAAASGPSSIETRTNDLIKSLGGATQC